MNKLHLNIFIVKTLNNFYGIKNIDALVTWSKNDIKRLSLGKGGTEELLKYLKRIRS